MAPTIYTLPTELHLLILSNLAYPEALALSYTCHYFHSLIPPPLLSTLRSEHILYIYQPHAFHRWYSKTYLPCWGCLRLLQRSSFDDEEWTRTDDARSWYRQEDWEKGVPPEMYCLRCKWKKGQWEVGAEKVSKGERHVYCSQCKAIKDATERDVNGVCHKCAPRALWKRDWGLAILEAVFVGLIVAVIWAAARGLREGPYAGLLVAGIFAATLQFLAIVTHWVSRSLRRKMADRLFALAWLLDLFLLIFWCITVGEKDNLRSSRNTDLFKIFCGVTVGWAWFLWLGRLAFFLWLGRKLPKTPVEEPEDSQACA